MKKLLMIMFLSCVFSAQSLASPLPDFTHNTLSGFEPAVVSQSYKIAGIYWLPDYLGKNLDNNGRVNDRNNDSGGDKNKSCTDYGFEACQSPKTLKPGSVPVQVVEGLKCYKNSDCICPAEYKYTEDNCFKIVNGTRKTAAGPDKCNGKSNTCTEDASFKYFYLNSDSQCYYKTSCSGCPNNSVAVSDPQNMWVNSLDKKIKVKKCRCSESSYPNETKIDNANCNSSCTNSEGKTTYSCNCNDGYTCSNGSGASCSAECVRDCPSAVTCAAGQKEIKSTKSTCEDITVGCCPAPVGTCEYGCLTYSDISGCTEVCTQCNDCKPDVNCTVENYPFTEANKPANAVLASCTSGCGDAVVRYKIAQCNAGYYNLDTFWCNSALRCLLK